MTSHSRPALHRSTVALLPAVTVLIALTGCSSGKERSYALPDNLCGAPVAPSTLAPLLPDGDKISQSKDTGPYSQRCRVYVDGTTAMSTGALWESSGTTPRQVAEGELNVSPTDTPEGNDIIHGRTGAVARVEFECPAAKKGSVMYVSMRLVDRKVKEKYTLAFIRSYAKGIRQTERCTGKHE